MRRQRISAPLLRKTANRDLTQRRAGLRDQTYSGDLAGSLHGGQTLSQAQVPRNGLVVSPLEIPAAKELIPLLLVGASFTCWSIWNRSSSSR